MSALEEPAGAAISGLLGLSPTRWIAAVVGMLGLLVLAGWFLDISLLKSGLQGAVEMQSQTALALVFAAASLAFLEGRPSPRALRTAQLLAVLPAAIGGATLCEYLFGWQLGIDELSLADTGSAFNPIPGRIPPFSAVALLFIGCTLVVIPWSARRPFIQLGGAIPAAIGAVSLVGYLWKASELTTAQWLPPVPVHSAMAFVLLGIGVLIAGLARAPIPLGSVRRDRISGLVEAKLLVGFIGSVILLCLAGGVTYRMGVNFANSAQQVINSQQVRAALGKLYASIADAESAQRNYLLIDLPVYRTEYGRLAARVGLHVEALRQLIESDPAQLSRLNALVPTIAGRMNALSNHVDIFDRLGEEAVRSAIATDDGVRSMASIRTQIAHMDSVEEAVLNARAAALARHRSYSLIALLTTVAIATVVLIVLFGSIVRDIRERARTNKALEQARSEARQATHAKSDFLAAMSHEIRTPMNGVIGMLDVLQESSLMCAQVEVVKLIRESADGLLRIIDDILDFSKIEAGRLDLESVPISVADVVEKTGGLLSRLAERKESMLTIFADPNIPAMVLGDPTRLRQVLINLTNNAIKFSSGLASPGRVSMRAVLLERSPVQVVVEFRIADNGIGMDEATLTKVFTSFTQADASTTRRYGGTGLGLVISKQLIGLMGGGITVKTEVNKGSTFTVRLPFAMPLQPLSASSVPSLIVGLPCLVVGGQTGLADDLAAYLKSDGAVVKRVPDLAAARDWTRAQTPGLKVWVVEAVDSTSTLGDLLACKANFHVDAHLRVVLVAVGRGGRRGSEVNADGVIAIDGNALNRRTLCKAVAIAAGRASTESAVAARTQRTNNRPPPTREEAICENRLILLAEDHDMNQVVIRRQLHLLGYAVDVAQHGREALQRWQTGEYALVLTDLHMPEMDGYELAMAIRANERGQSHTPIIALTANALAGEAARCRDVGMDGYLSKPAALTQLAATLHSWLPIPALSHAAANSNSAPVDKAVLEALVGADPQVVSEFLQQFGLTATRLGAELRDACTMRRTADAAAIAHKLKSCAISVGALRLGELCAAIEVAGADADVSKLTTLQARFDAEMSAVGEYLCSLKHDQSVRSA